MRPKPPEAEREFYTWQTAKRVDTLYKQHTHNTDYKGIKEMNILRNIKKKLSENSAMITQSDKGNSIVILKRVEYNQKITDYTDSSIYNTSTETTEHSSA